MALNDVQGGASDRRRLPLTPVRVICGLVVIMLLSAFTTGMVWHHQVVDKLTNALSKNKSLAVATSDLASSSFGGAQTLLLVGNDQRAHTTTTPVLPHSNEMLLVRIDPSKPWISMMSLPRELDVPIDTANGVIRTRLNAAMTYGGMELMLKTIKQVTGLGINHVVEIDFNNFVKAVNDIGCTYSTIDRRYFHVNVPGAPAADNYTEVNLLPGYQNLCGSQALQFVSYRHGDTSQERDSRDQDFLLSVKQQYGPSLVSHVTEFEQIFGELVQTDKELHTASGVTDLLGTLVSVAGLPVRQVHFQANLNMVNTANCNDCDSATPQQIKASVDSFLYGANSTLTRAAAQQVANSATSTTSSTTKAGSKTKTKKSAKKTASKQPSSPYLPTPASDVARAAHMATAMRLPVWFPTIAVNNGQAYPTAFRSYAISDLNHVVHPIYVVVFSTGMLGQYYDVQGTTWRNPPILRNPSQKIKASGRTYYVYYANHTITQVAWFTGDGAYWVRNTLTNSLNASEMMSIAEHSVAHNPVGFSTLQTIAAAKPTTAPSALITKSSSLKNTLGFIAGILTLLAVGGLGILTIRQILASRRVIEQFDQSSGKRIKRLNQRVGQLTRIARGQRART